MTTSVAVGDLLSVSPHSYTPQTAVGDLLNIYNMFIQNIYNIYNIYIIYIYNIYIYISDKYIYIYLWYTYIILSIYIYLPSTSTSHNSKVLNYAETWQRHRHPRGRVSRPASESEYQHHIDLESGLAGKSGLQDWKGFGLFNEKIFTITPVNYAPWMKMIYDIYIYVYPIENEWFFSIMTSPFFWKIPGAPNLQQLYPRFFTDLPSNLKSLKPPASWESKQTTIFLAAT